MSGALEVCFTSLPCDACTLQVACILLPLAFAYDVFWVFLSPLLFNGTSVMVEVGGGWGLGKCHAHCAAEVIQETTFSSAMEVGLPWADRLPLIVTARDGPWQMAVRNCHVM